MRWKILMMCHFNFRAGVVSSPIFPGLKFKINSDPALTFRVFIQSAGDSMRFLDLFAGIGGFRLALEREGHKCIGFCEGGS